MAIASSQLWTAGDAPSTPETGYTRIYLNNNNEIILIDDAGNAKLANLMLSGTTDPTATTNPTMAGIGYFNTVTGRFFICTNATTDANVWVTQANLSGASDPTATTNPLYVGRFYTNTTTGIVFTCIDATTDANVWVGVSFNMTGSSNPTATTNPVRVGILFTNTTTGVIFTCTDATVDANHWIGTDGTSI